MNYLPIDIERSYLLKENEHEYKTKYTYSVEDSAVTAERNVLPSVSGHSVMLYGLDDMLHYNIPPYYIEDAGAYQELEFRIFEPYAWNYLDDVASSGGYATVKISLAIDPYQTGEYIIYWIKRTSYDDGRSAYQEYRVNDPPQQLGLSNLALRVSGTSIITPYGNGASLGLIDIFQTEPPHSILIANAIPIYKPLTSGSHWTHLGFKYSSPSEQTILIKNNPFGKTNNKKIVTQNLERSIIT